MSASPEPQSKDAGKTAPAPYSFSDLPAFPEPQCFPPAWDGSALAALSSRPTNSRPKDPAKRA